MIFRNPAVRIKPGKREHAIWQPLTAGQLAEAAAAAATPQARLCLVLAAVHAARSARSGHCSSTMLTSAASGCTWPAPAERWVS